MGLRPLLLICLLLITLPLWAGIKVHGTLKAEKKCQTKEDFLLVLSHQKNQSLEYLYQLELPTNGKFEFVVKPGTYILEAVSSNGCIVNHQIQVKKNATEFKQDMLLAKRSE